MVWRSCAVDWKIIEEAQLTVADQDAGKRRGVRYGTSDRWESGGTAALDRTETYQASERRTVHADFRADRGENRKDRRGGNVIRGWGMCRRDCGGGGGGTAPGQARRLAPVVG